MLAERIRTMGAPHWLALFGLILTAWALLWVMAVPSEYRLTTGIYGEDFWRELCALTPDSAGLARMAAMWSLMSAAMMAPTILPAVATYDDLAGAGAATRMGRLLAGYFLVWLGFAGVAAGVQLILFRAGLLDPLGQATTVALTAVLLLLAGLYQFAPLKAACLSKCRRPLTFFMAHWDEGPLRNGLRLGLVCLGCCWALMALAFVGGVMNLGFMALATVTMVLEKLPEIGRHVTRPLGLMLLAGSAGVLTGLV